MLPMTVPEPVMSLAIMPKARETTAAFGKALNRFTKEDPTFKVGLAHCCYHLSSNVSSQTRAISISPLFLLTPAPQSVCNEASCSEQLIFLLRFIIAIDSVGGDLLCCRH